MLINVQREAGSFWVSKHTESSKRMPEIVSICVALVCMVQASGCAEIFFRQCVFCVCFRVGMCSSIAHFLWTMEDHKRKTKQFFFS